MHEVIRSLLWPISTQVVQMHEKCLLTLLACKFEEDGRRTVGQLGLSHVEAEDRTEKPSEGLMYPFLLSQMAKRQKDSQIGRISGEPG